MTSRSKEWASGLLISTLCWAAAAAPPKLDLPPGPQQVPYSPADGGKASTNPPAFLWLPIPRAASYVLEVSRSRTFPADATIRRECAISLEVPRQLLEPGQWFWRYGVVISKGAAPVFSRDRAFVIPADAPRVPFPDVKELLRRLSAGRPRIGLLPNQLDEWRTKARGEMRWAAAPVLAMARRAIGQPLMPEPARLPPRGDPARGAAYTRAFMTMRPFTAAMNACAEAYLLTGDEACGQEARRRLMHLVAWDPHGSTSLAENDEAGTDIVRLCSRAFDYIHPLLGESERRRCRETLAVRIPQLYHALRRRPFESNPFESHAMDYYIRDLTESCLAMAGEIDSADGVPLETIFEYLLLQLWSPFYPPFGGEDGGWSEGPSYWSWSTLTFARTFKFIEQWTGSPVRERPWLRQTPFYKLYANPPYSKMSPFGDGVTGPVVGRNTMLALAAMLREPHALWYAQREGFVGVDAFLFQTCDLKPKPPDDLPQARCFRDVGLAAMHSALADGDRNVEVLLRSSPYGSTSHGYADQNAFVMHAFGEPLAISTGCYDHYASPHHKSWTWQTKAANSITVNGEGQTIRSPLAKGRIAAFATGDYAHYAMGDARDAYTGRLERFDRHVVFLRPHAGSEAMVVIADDLQSKTPARFEWWLHALEKMQVDDATASVTIHRGAARLAVRFLTPGRLRFEQSTGFPVPPDGSLRNTVYPDPWHLTAHADEPAARRRFVTVLLPCREGAESSLSAARLLEGRNCVAVELRASRARHVILFRNAGQSGTMEAAGLRSDANVLAGGFDPAGSRFGVLEIP